MDKISLVIPTLNERKGIVNVIEEIPFKAIEEKGYKMEVTVIDGGSTDGTDELVRDLDVELLYQKCGKASAVRRGISESDARFLFIIDGDGSYPPEHIVEMLDMLEKGYDMVLGSRFSGRIEEGAMNLVNRFGNRILTGLCNVLYGTDITDLCTGLRGINMDALNDCRVPGKNFEIEAGMISVINDNIAEIPITYKKRDGYSKLHVLDGLHIAKRLIIEKFKEWYR